MVTNTINLNKGKHRFSITFDAGSESTVLDELVQMVHRKDVPFDWFDCSVMSHQLGQQMAGEIARRRKAEHDKAQGN